MNLGDIFFMIILVVSGIMFVAPIAIFIYSMIKKRKKLLLGACVALFIEVMIILFWASHQTYYKYNDWWIVGKSEEEIVERYGEFDKSWGKSKAYFIYVDNGWIMPEHQEHYYHIEFDSTGIATKVYDGLAPGA